MMISAKVEGLYQMNAENQSAVPIVVSRCSFASLMTIHHLNSRMISEELKGWASIDNPRGLVIKAIQNMSLKRGEMIALVWAVNIITKRSYTISDIEFLEAIAS